MLVKRLLTPSQLTLLSKRTIVNINRMKIVKEKRNLDSEENIANLFDQLRRENEELDQKYRYASENNKLGYTPEDPVVPTDEKAYDLTIEGEIAEYTKNRIYSDEKIPKDKKGVPLLYTSDAKFIYSTFRHFSLKNYTPLDSVKFTHTKILNNEIFFEDGVQIKMKVSDFVEEKLLPFLGPERYQAWRSKKVTEFKRGGLGSSKDKNSVHHDYDRLTLKEISEIQDLYANFKEEFKDEIKYYKMNADKEPNLKKPTLDRKALSKKYNVPKVAISRVLNSVPLSRLPPEVLERRIKNEEKRLKRVKEEKERAANELDV